VKCRIEATDSFGLRLGADENGQHNRTDGKLNCGSRAAENEAITPYRQTQKLTPNQSPNLRSNGAVEGREDDLVRPI
jgi:hypothetical protein